MRALATGLILAVLSGAAAAQPATQPDVPEARREARWDDFEDYRLGLFTQDVIMHRARAFSKIWNDNRSNEITQSALLKRVLLRYRLGTRFDVGLAVHMSLRDEATYVDGVMTESYHPFKAASLLGGFRLYVKTLKRARAEVWTNLRLDLALSERVLDLSALHGDLELALVFHGNALVSFSVEAWANRDDGAFVGVQYGVGYRF